MWWYSLVVGVVIGIQSNSMCGFKIAHSLMQIRNELYFKPEYSNTIYSDNLVCIDTTDYTTNLDELEWNIHKHVNKDSFQKPIFNVNTQKVDNIETIDSEHILFYGPYVNLIKDKCNYTVYVDVDIILGNKYLGDECVDCDFNPDCIVGVNYDYVEYLHKGDAEFSIIKNYPYKKIIRNRYEGVKIENFYEELLPNNLHPKITGLFSLIKLLLVYNLNQIII